jgi:hypothetical protein
LDSERFDADTTRIMGVAFELARAALRVPSALDPILPVSARSQSRSGLRLPPFASSTIFLATSVSSTAADV